MIDAAKLYMEKGLSLSFISDEAKIKGLEINWYKTAEDMYFEDFSPKRILSLFKEEGINVPKLDKFIELIQQPKRANGGYEESRAIIYEFYKGRETEIFNKLINYAN